MLSNSVKTRDIMTGTFAGKIPVYGLGVLYLTPILLSPYVIIYKVSVTGQLLMYATLVFVALSTLWFSNVLCTAIQAKLGESPRGNDIARSLSIVVGLATILPMYLIIFLAEPFAAFMGLEIFTLFPFTWGADLVTWVIIGFNGINLSLSNVIALENILGLPPIGNLGLLIAFTLGMVAIALVTADRLFTIEAGARTERVVTVGKENIFLRGIRRSLPGTFGILLVSTLKDFTRKAQNTSKVAFGIVLAILLPQMMNTAGLGNDDPGLMTLYVSLSGGIILAMIGAMTFGGVGFLDSKDQLWILKSAPDGVSKYVKARIAESLVFALPMAWIASTIMCIITVQHGYSALIVAANATIAVIGSVLVSTGITANNPNYTDTQSQTFKDNTGFCMIVIMMMTLMSLPIGFLTNFQNLTLMAVGPSLVLLSLGILFVTIGTRRLARPD
ncbi:MAG: hypothetical protein ACFE7R_00590 [Candidatus Hodarchaeota archaeon]